MSSKIICIGIYFYMILHLDFNHYDYFDYITYAN